MVNTAELQTHLLATSKGKNYHKMRQQAAKPLENPFIGYVFSDESGTVGSLQPVTSRVGDLDFSGFLCLCSKVADSLVYVVSVCG